MSRSSSESSETDSCKDEHGFIDRLGGIPVLKSVFSQASFVYSKAKEATTMTKISLSFAEMSINAAVESTKYAYNVIPTSGIVGTLKDGVEKKVVEADALACKGLDFLQEKCPSILSEPKEIISTGIEKSEMVEAALIVSEAAVDYLNPAVNKTEVTVNTKPQVVSSRKVDRIIDVSQKTGRVIYHGGSKILWDVAVAPWYATQAGVNVARQAAVDTAHLTLNVMSYIPGLSALISPQTKPRRSDRRRITIQRKPETDKSPFPYLPDKKRKRDSEDSNSDDDNLYEMLYVNEYNANSDEDPDYSPEDHVISESESDDSSDTVAANDERDSGEGDETEVSDTGGQSLTAEQVKRTVRFEDGHVVHGPEGSLVVHITEGKPSTVVVHTVEKEDHKTSGRSENQQEAKTDGAAFEMAKEEKNKKADETKTSRSLKAQAKRYFTAAGKENLGFNVENSPSQKKPSVGSAKPGEETKLKPLSNKEAQSSNKKDAAKTK